MTKTLYDAFGMSLEEFAARFGEVARPQQADLLFKLAVLLKSKAGSGEGMDRGLLAAGMFLQAASQDLGRRPREK